MTQTFEEYQRDKREREWRDRVQKQKEALGNAERVQRARDWKAIANEKVKAGNFPEARDYYREAIILVEDLVEARRQERIELLMPLYCNLAQVHLKLGEHGSVEEVAGKALEIASVPRNEVPAHLRAKAHFRRACALRTLGRLEEAREDLVHAQNLQPSSEEASQELSAVKALLQAQAEEARSRNAGFLDRKAAPSQEKLAAAEEKRAERRARAEQRQQMQRAFQSLAKGEMLYGAREKEMEPVRQKQQQQRKTLELEQSLLNIVDGAKGDGTTEEFEEFLRKKEERGEAQHEELAQERRVLEKQAKEEEWCEDDAWQEQRQQQRLQLEQERREGLRPEGPPRLWESREVQRWCEQSLRSRLLAASVDGDGELKPQLAAAVCRSDGSGSVLRALVTNVAKLQGDAAVIRLSPAKPPLHFFDYFLKLHWEVGVVRPQEEAYRTADKLIEAAAADDGKAPPTVMAHCLLAGTLKIREFSSEEEPADGCWPLLTKVKRREGAAAAPLMEAAEKLQRVLAGRVQMLLQEWAEEYRQHWP